MKYLKILMLIAMVFTMLWSLGCNKAEPTIVGKWKNQTMPEMVQFNKDHTGTFVVKDHPALAFTWTMSKKDFVQLNVAYQGRVETLNGRIDKNTLILEGKGAQAVYSKAE